MPNEVEVLDETRGKELAAPANSMLEIIERASRDPAVDVDKLDKLLQMSERTQAREAERVFNAAMNAAQKEMDPVRKDAANPSTKSKYASYAALDHAVRPIYTKHGFSLSFDTGDAPENMVKVLCYVAHDDGHSRTYKIDMPADGKGAKGADVMTRTHATGSGLSYGQRYLLKAIFNIAVSDDDGNGAGDTAEAITAEQAQTIRELMERVGGDPEKFCAYFKIEAVPDLKAKDFQRAVAALNLKEKKIAK